MIEEPVETPNPNPDEVEDDGLGIPEVEPFDPSEVDEDEAEDKGESPNHYEGD